MLTEPNRIFQVRIHSTYRLTILTQQLLFSFLLYIVENKCCISILVKWKSESKRQTFHVLQNVCVQFWCSSTEQLRLLSTSSQTDTGQPRESVLTASWNNHPFLFLQQIIISNKHEKKKNKNATSAHSLDAKRHCRLKYREMKSPQWWIFFKGGVKRHLFSFLDKHWLYKGNLPAGNM